MSTTNDGHNERDPETDATDVGETPAGGVQNAKDAERERLREFLAGAPDDLKPWATGQLAAMDAPAAKTAARPTVPPAWKPPSRRKRSAVLPLAAIALVGGVIWTVYTLNDKSAAMPAGHPSVSAMPSNQAQPTAAPLDEAKVAQLKQKVAANPKDVESLKALAMEYFRASQFQAASQWQQKVVDLKPKDLDERLILGVTQFNQQKYDEAEATWLAAAKLDPKSADPWYNLGFLYMSKEPVDTEKVRDAWTRVVDLAPGSEIAKTVESHLSSLEGTAAPSPKATPTPTPSKK